MDAQSIKDYIFSNDKVETVLENLEMHHIQWHNGKQYVTCGMPDGDNPNSTVIYCDNSFLQVKAYRYYRPLWDIRYHISCQLCQRNNILSEHKLVV